MLFFCGLEILFKVGWVGVQRGNGEADLEWSTAWRNGGRMKGGVGVVGGEDAQILSVFAFD